ncbi:MAG: tyrosine-type recombinase/integrase [Bacteroidales bacterium]|nr:tyrosine-type recombinase/integrase [Bacteroidales bacterium]
MTAWITDFLDYMLAQRGASPRTIEVYRIALDDAAAHFVAAFAPISWATIEQQHVRHWVASMMERGYAPRTVARSLSALRSFFKYLLREGRVEVDPARLVRNPKQPKRLPTFVRESEMDRLFAHYPFADDYVGQRDRTILLMLYHTGLRSAELLSLDLSDVDLRVAQLRVTGKGNKQRLVPFGEELSMALQHYLEVRASFVSDKPHDVSALFLSARATRLTYDALRVMVRTTLSAVTTQHKKTPHVLRHSFATAMLAHGAQLEAIQQLLGHESVATTAIYTHTTLAELKSQYAQAHPRSEGEAKKGKKEEL